MWYFLRVSGLALVFLAGGHLFITHYLNVPSDTTFDFVSARWANPLWRTFDTLLLFAALWHGLIGLRFSIKDLLHGRGARQVGFSLLWIFGIVFTVLGLITIITFDEQMARDISRHLLEGAPLPVSIVDALEAGLLALAMDDGRRTRTVVDMAPTWKKFDAVLAGREV